ncbi:MAG: HEPN domain-containing protein [Prevotellaceae bacterium]|jgi:HEPN domain-containing protein|nr:HEPN domain-containing protein [Prevotellaceae bacterium]
MEEDEKIVNVEKVFQHWISSSDKDFEAMMKMYQSEYYNWALFLGHIVLEKLIKAYHLKATSTHTLFSHDLRLLANRSGLNMPQDMALQLDVITGFNINARYDSFKEDFYKRCTPEYTAEWIDKIKDLQLWIKAKL